MEGLRKYRDVIDQLKLNDKYPKKLSLKKALEVSETEITAEDLKDSGKIPWFILQNLIMCNYEGRCFEVGQNQSQCPVMGQSLFCTDNQSIVYDDAVRVSPSDAMVALFMCCDDFLRQLLIEKLSMCQLAIPLIIPTYTSPNTSEMLLWGMRTLRKQWKTCSGLSCEQSMAVHPLPIVSAIRFGRPRISKSKTLNYVISHLKHDVFFHSECYGGTLERRITDGLLESAWYLPSGKKQDILAEAVTFMNLRGNASLLKKQAAYLFEISLATIAFMRSDSLNKKDIASLELLCKQNGHIILVMDGKPVKQVQESLRLLEQNVCSKVKNKKMAAITAVNKNELEISKDIKLLLKSTFEGNGRSNVHDKSIESLVDVAIKNGLKIDENAKDFVNAKAAAKKMFADLKPIGKEQLPLQKFAKRIGKIEKEQHRMEHQGSKGLEMYSDLMKSELTSLRKQQNRVCKNQPGLPEKFVEFCKLKGLPRRHFYSYVKIFADEYSIKTLQPIRQEYIVKWKKLCEDQRDNRNSVMESQKKELDELENRLSRLSLGLEHFNREIGQIYEMNSHLKPTKHTPEFAIAAAEMLLNGHPLELMNGDASHVPIIWIKAVLTSLHKNIQNKRMFVLSVLGIQSSGKSTMLNAMFGLQFAVSAGRCTKGVFAQLVSLDNALQEKSGYNYILVVDTEGLRAPELASPEHSNRDNEFATLVIGLGDVTIINIMGENTSEMQDILQIAVHAFIKMNIVNIKPSCIFVHQNITDVAAADRNTSQKRSIKALLDNITQCAAEEENCSDKYQQFSDVIQFQEDKNVMYVSSLWRGDPPMAPPNPGYSECILQVRKQIVKFMLDSKNSKEAKTVKDFPIRLSDIWEAILFENFVFSFKNTIEIRAYNALQQEYLKHSRTVRRNAMTYTDTLQLQCKKLNSESICIDGITILQNQIAEFKKDAAMLSESMEEYFKGEPVAIQWQATTAINIDTLYDRTIKEMQDTYEFIKKKIIGRAEIDSSFKEKEKSVLKKAKGLAETFRNTNLSESDLKKKFDDEWIKWINDIPDIHSDIDIKASFETIFRDRFKRDCKEVNEMLPKFLSDELHQVGLMVKESDLNFGFNFQNIKRCFQSAIRYAPSTSVCIQSACSIVTDLQSQVSKDISKQSNKCKNYTEQFGYLLTDVIIKELESVKIDNDVSIKRLALIRITMSIISSKMQELMKLKEKYRAENDLRSYMKSGKGNLWQVFRDECKMVKFSVTAASLISQEFESAINNCLPNQCKTGVIDHLRTSKNQVFVNKITFHASVLIDLAEKRKFDNYKTYLFNPFQCMKTYIEIFIKELCFKEIEEGITILQKIYFQKLQDCFILAEKAINDTCEQCEIACKISVWWPKLLEHVDSNLNIKQELGFFNEDCSFEVEDLRKSLLCELNKAKDRIKTAFNGNDILPTIIDQCRQFFEDLLGCPEVCPFCHAPCDIQDRDENGDHRTEYHRPRGVSGRTWKETNKLVTDVCTTAVISEDTSSKVKATGDKWHHYKDYQSVNDLYKAWKIQPVVGESQVYWKWFMATYNKQLAEYYNCEPADIPDGWKEISWDSAMEDIRNTYHM